MTNYERNDSKSRRKKVAPAMPAVRCPNRAAASNVCRSSFWCQPARASPPYFCFQLFNPMELSNGWLAVCYAASVCAKLGLDLAVPRAAGSTMHVAFAHAGLAST